MTRQKISSFWLISMAAVCGAVVMAVELLGARMLSVGYGGSLSVWASMIAVTLLSLAVGYFAGGYTADRFPKPVIVGIVAVGAGIMIAISPYLRFVLKICYHTMGIQGGALASSAIIFFVPLCLLGMISPFVIKLLSEKGKGIGLTAGSVYAVSTIGSVAGTLVTGLWMIPGFGIDTCFRITALCAMIFGIIGIVLHTGLKGSPSLACIVITLLPYSSPRIGEEYTAPDNEKTRIEAVYESPHGHITVLTKGRYRLLMVDGIVQTGIPLDLPHLVKGECLKNHYFQELIPFMVPDPSKQEVLIIGLAGGMTASVLQKYGMKLDCVDLDPVIIEVARKWFFFTGKAEAADGRRYLESCSKQYDFCVIDTYSGDIFPFYLATIEAFTAVKKVLSERGVLVINYIGTPLGKPFRSVRATLEKVFSHTLALKGEAGDDVQTITLFASDRVITFNRGWLDYFSDFSGVDPVSEAIHRFSIPLSGTKGLILTDNYNPIDSMRAREALRWRERTAGRIGEKVLF